MPAFLAAPLFRWLLIGAIIAALARAVVWYRHEAHVARLEANSWQNAALLAQDDAKRWQAAASQRDSIIADLRAQLDRITADAQESARQAIVLVDAAEARADATERKLADLRRQANAANDADKPRALSPYARSGLDWLRCRSEAGPGADTGSC